MGNSDIGSEASRDRLLLLGAVLFVLGLASGLFTGLMENPRMGLSAHMQGITNGTFLLAVGAIWNRVKLGRAAKAVAFWSFAIGTTTNWLMTQMAAFWGTGRLTPIIAPDPKASPWQEAVVSSGLLLLSLTMLVGGFLLVVGLARSLRCAED